MLDEPPDFANIIAIFGEENDGFEDVVTLVVAVEGLEEGEVVEAGADAFFGVLGQRVVAVMLEVEEVVKADTDFERRTGLSKEMASEEES